MDRRFEAVTAGHRSPLSTSVLPNHGYAFLGYAAFVGGLALVAAWSAPGRGQVARNRSAAAFPVDDQRLVGSDGASGAVADASPPRQREGA